MVAAEAVEGSDLIIPLVPTPGVPGTDVNMGPSEVVATPAVFQFDWFIPPEPVAVMFANV